MEGVLTPEPPALNLMNPPMLRRTRTLLGILALLGLLLPAMLAANPDFTLQKGVNISHWLSQRYAASPPLQHYFSEMEMVFLKEQGFDHIRLPIDEENLWDEEGRRIEANFKWLHRAIRWALRQEMRVVVDLHIVRSHYFNAAHEGRENTLFTDPAAQDQFLDLWRQLSTELKDYPVSMVAYEFLNESVAEDNEDWNKLVARVHAVVRELEPKRVFVIGSNHFQSVHTFPDLRVPDDRNLILSFHFYEPFPLTHYQASWTFLQPYKGPIDYPGQLMPPDVIAAIKDPQFREQMANHNGVWDKERLAARLQPALDKARELDLPLYCGEFGCYTRAPREARLRWHADIVAVFAEHDIAWSLWDYKGGFGIAETGDAAVDWELVAILTGAQPPNAGDE